MAKTETTNQLIVCDPNVQGGEPVIRDTRVPVRAIVIAAEEYGGDLTRVGHAFSIDIAAVKAGLDYYAQHKAEIRQLIEKHERAALA